MFAKVAPGCPCSHIRPRITAATASPPPRQASRPPRRGLRRNRPAITSSERAMPAHIAADYRHGGIPERLQEYKKRAITACELFSPGQCSFLLCGQDMRCGILDHHQVRVRARRRVKYMNRGFINCTYGNRMRYFR